MNSRFVLKAGILLAILLLVLPVSVESVKAGLHIDSIAGGPGVTTTVSTTSVEENVTITCSVKGGFLPLVARGQQQVYELTLEIHGPSEGFSGVLVIIYISQ